MKFDDRVAPAERSFRRGLLTKVGKKPLRFLPKYQLARMILEVGKVAEALASEIH